MPTRSAYAAFLEILFTRQAPARQFTLVRIRALLDALGAPERHLRVVLVAGTNGKGTTARLLANSQLAAGRRVGLYTSPHLLRFAERIRVDDEPIDEASVLAIGRRVFETADSLAQGASFFECVTAMAFVYFQSRRVDIAIVEVGVGGRLDATNACTPLLSVVTRIGLDHVGWLGTTLSAIAREKAGIFRPHVSAVAGPQDPVAREALAACAQKAEAPLVHAAVTEPTHPLYFAESLATARAANLVLETQGLGVPDEAFAQAVARGRPRGRYEWVLHQKQTYLLDAGHNPDGCRALAQAISTCPRAGERKLVLLFGCLADKAGDEMLRLLAPHVSHLVIAPLTGPRAMTPSAQKALSERHAGQTYSSFSEALAVARHHAEGQRIILAVGSLRLLSGLLVALGEGPADPEVAG